MKTARMQLSIAYTKWTIITSIEKSVRIEYMFDEKRKSYIHRSVDYIFRPQGGPKPTLILTITNHY